MLRDASRQNEPAARALFPCAKIVCSFVIAISGACICELNTTPRFRKKSLAWCAICVGCCSPVLLFNRTALCTFRFTMFRLARVATRVASGSVRSRAVFTPRVAARLQPVVSTRVCVAAFSSDVQTFLDRGEVTERVIGVLKNFERVDPAKVTPTAHFVDDFGLDSLDAVEICMALEEEFCIAIPDEEAEKILSTEDAIQFIATHPQAK